MTDKQLKLFRLPSPTEIRLTLTDRELLAWVEFSQGQFTAWPRRYQPRTLRRLIEKRLVRVIALSPARYLITPLGQAVRARYSQHEQHERKRPPLVTTRLFLDGLDHE